MRRLAFASYKGGVGRTYAAVAIANTLARLGRNVLIIDMDVNAPDIPMFYGLETWEVMGAGPESFVEWAVGTEASLDTHVVQVPHPLVSLRLLPAGPVGADYLGRLTAPEWQRLFVSIQTRESFSKRLNSALSTLEPSPDFVVVDCRAGLGPATQWFLQEFADDIVFFFGGDQGSVNSINLIRNTIEMAIDGRSRSLVPVLSRYPAFLDPDIHRIGENLARLRAPGELIFLPADPGHEGSRYPTIGLDQDQDYTPLAIDHLRLFRRLIPDLAAEQPSDHSLAEQLDSAGKAPSIDWKLFSGIARGEMLNPVDQSRNVAFRVTTISGLFDHFAASMGRAGMTEGAVAQDFREAGMVPGEEFGAALAERLDERGVSDSVERLIVWCTFDSAVGFGRMEARHDEQHDELVIDVFNPFLSPPSTGKLILEGYVLGVVTRLLELKDAAVRMDWTVAEIQPSLGGSRNLAASQLRVHLHGLTGSQF